MRGGVAVGTVNSVGERLRHYRKLHRLTQKQLATELGVASKCISNIEEGLKKPNLDMLVEICRWFNVFTACG